MEVVVQQACEMFLNAPFDTMTQNEKYIEELKEKIDTNSNYYLAWDREFMGDVDLTNVLNKGTIKKFRKNLSPFYPFNKGLSSQEVCFCELIGHQALLMYFFEAYVLLKFYPESCRKKISNLIRRSFRLLENHYEKHPLRKQYIDGVNYLWRWITLHVQVLQKSFISSVADLAIRTYNGDKEFHKLNDKSKAIVKGLKWMLTSSYFQLSQSDKCHQAEVIILRQVISLDPKEYCWHYLFQNRLRFLRSKADYANISEEEIRTLWETYAQCEYEKIDPLDGNKSSKWRNIAFAGVLQGIAEAARANWKLTNGFYVTFGDLEFNNVGDMANFVKTEVSRLISESNCTFAEYIRVGEILAYILPRHYRDLDVAEKCYLAAQKLENSNSKLNHKLGVLYVSKHTNKTEGVTKALPFLREAIRIAPENFSALGDLLRALLHSHKENEAEFIKTLDTYRNMNTARNVASVIADLKRSEGYFKFMCNLPIAAIECWLEAYDINESTTLSELSYNLWMYGWSTNLISQTQIRSALKTYADNNSHHESAINVLLSSIRDNLQINQKTTRNENSENGTFEGSRGNWRSSTSHDLSFAPLTGATYSSVPQNRFTRDFPDLFARNGQLGSWRSSTSSANYNKGYLTDADADNDWRRRDDSSYN